MSDQRGFTIIESLVALAVLAITMVALYEAIGTGFRTFDRAAETEDAVLVAQSQLDRIVAQRRLPTVRQGTVDDTVFRWQLSVVPPRNAKLTLLRLTVTWPGRAAGIVIERLVLLDAAP